MLFFIDKKSADEVKLIESKRAQNLGEWWEIPIAMIVMELIAQAASNNVN